MSAIRLHIIVGSTRPGRAGAPVAAWFSDIATAHGAFDVTMVDLLEWDLPMLSEPHHPRLGQYTRELTRRFSATINTADAFVIVTPEYNYGYTAPVKNALDHLYREWNDKAVGFVGYGGAAGAARAVQMLKQVVTTLKMTPVFEGVYIPFVQTLIDNAQFQATEGMATAAGQMLDELARVSQALSSLRVST
ncbi:flavin reductase [Mycolicibacterium canariasense]|uniref:Flavin reductase n=1 Tax=Mycolicibacterium canariasense TaxID=228230 RepID=A0A117IBS4_MYCCR|nr:NADPH-dependent FMN reductase [Mycolicibacterium canariasense]GAS98330.1 flavin reductase [Mycolicibacterium canariasense]